MNVRSLTATAVLISITFSATSYAQENDADQPSFLQQFLDSIAQASEPAPDGIDAYLADDLDLRLDSDTLTDPSLDVPEANAMAIPPPPPPAVFHKQPEDDVFEVPMREVFPFEAFDYEEGTPTLYCMPARVCSVELEPGEVILGRALGDPDRWLYQELAAGPPDSSRALIALMPKHFGARTNLVITTDRRVYTLSLASAEIDDAGDAASAPLTERARFTYPQGWVETRSRSLPAVAASELSLKPAREPIAKHSASPADLHFGYSVLEPTKAKRRFGWTPTVYDDGRRTYVLLPRQLSALPAIRGRDSSREPFLLNETYHHGDQGTYIDIPRLANTLELFLGTGRERKIMTIVRHPSLP